MDSLSLILLANIAARRRTKRQRQVQAAPQTVPAFAEQNSGGVLCGYWFEWEPRVPLTEIPSDYNYICIAFLHQTAFPMFTTHFFSKAEIANGIKSLKAEGRKVLISIGGASGEILLYKSDKEDFKSELIELIDEYGFDGADIDLEGGSVNAGDNAAVIPAVLRELKDYYRSLGREFLITMAPEFIYLRGNDAAYRPYVSGLEGYYDLIWPQYYNQGLDGIWSPELNMYLSQNDDARKAEFLYALTHAIVTGTADYMKIPADKFAIGLPASPASAGNGYVVNPADVKNALNRLSAEGNKIRGLMTWSINQDYANGYEFVRRYGAMV